MDNQSLVFLGEDANFTGEIEASHIILHGKINGVARAEHSIRLKPGSHMKGEVYTEHFFPEEGSVYDGKLHIIASEKSELDSTSKQNQLQKAATPSGIKKVAAMLSSWALW